MGLLSPVDWHMNLDCPGSSGLSIPVRKLKHTAAIVPEYAVRHCRASRRVRMQCATIRIHCTSNFYLSEVYHDNSLVALGFS